jgi:hypothetical protein
MASADPGRLAALIGRLLEARVGDTAAGWLEQLFQRAQAGDRAGVSVGFSQLPRRFATGPVELAPEEVAQATAARPGWQPHYWSLDELGRARVMLALYAQGDSAAATQIEALFLDADLAEQVALYKALCLLPQPERWVARAAEGIRSNMKAVFEAVALDNPFPAEQFSEAQWNQLVLKCLFVDSPLLRVHGLDARVNPTLAAMLCDYARERWAASREVSPELWRCVGPVADAAMLTLMQRVFERGRGAEQLAAARSLLDNELATTLLAQHAPRVRRLQAAGLSWQQIRDYPGTVETLLAQGLHEKS